MKKLWILSVCLTVVFIVAASLAGQPVVKKYWQDVIIKPDQAWRETYGHDNDSLLAHNIAKLIAGLNAQAQALSKLRADHEALRAEVDELRAIIDPNEVVDPNEDQKAKAPG